MKKLFCRTFLILTIFMCMTGCAKLPGNNGVEDQPPTGPVSITGETDKPYRVEQLIPVKIEDPDVNFAERRIYPAAYGSKYYLLVYYLTDEFVPSAICSYTFDMDTQKAVKQEFAPEALKQMPPSFLSMFAAAEDELTLLLNSAVTDTDDADILYTIDLTGKPLDSAPSSLQGDGLTEILSQVNSRLFGIPDASPILTEWAADTNTARIYSLDMATGSRTLLAELKDSFVTALCPDGRNGLYYISGMELWHLDLDEQTSQVLCNIRSQGIEAFHYNLLIDSQGRLALCTADGTRPMAYLLTDEEEVFDQNTLRLVRLDSFNSNYLPSMATKWSTTSGSCKVKTESASGSDDQATLRDRTMMEIVSGKGPELMWVSDKDMRILAEKGALMDLSEIIPEDVKEQLLPGVQQAGTIDGKWVGITPEVDFCTVLTPDSVWSGDSWTATEVMDLVESRDDWEWPFTWNTGRMSASTMFWGFFAEDLTHSSYMDFENGISYFNGEEFIRTLEFCRKYGQDNPAGKTWDELYQMMGDGKCAACRAYYYDGMPSFASNMDRLPNCHTVGIPTNNSSGSYLYSSEGYLVVNANTANKDAIQSFITYLLDYDSQFTVKTHSPVRKDVLRDRVNVRKRNPWNDEDDEMVCTIQISTSNPTYIMLPLKPDGSSYLEDFMAFAEGCGPKPYCPEAITDILAGELNSFFNGDKTAKDTAEIIHRKVQLYFDENR